MFHERFMRNQRSETSHVGSMEGHRVVNRNREEAHQNMYADYFSSNPRFDANTFRRRFRMSRTLFQRIINVVTAHNVYFQQCTDVVSRVGLSFIQKVTAAMRILAYGIPADAVDEYCKIAESTAIESFKKFCHSIVEIFSEQYPRSPNANDIARLLHIGKSCGFPGMLGSLDCMHWQWKNCPTAWHGQYSGRSGSPIIILEAVADYDLWIWYAYFGMPGTNNDINVLESSHLFSNLANSIAPPMHYTIQRKKYHMGYYLADGIYPKWSTLVQTIQDPQTLKMKHFAKKQESCRKDVERAFGVLQSKFAIIRNPVRFWKKNVLQDVMRTCIILHNMIIEDERDLEAPINVLIDKSTANVQMRPNYKAQFNEFLERQRQIKDQKAHFELRNALIEHLWEEHSNSAN
ncbi:protein ALP1-like [Euphorbia lathyris]|uniref:protein ALP1-like n=1 Tax=Euphorbia lathyris TaxID=212925 RepID=UPI0033131B82